MKSIQRLNPAHYKPASPGRPVTQTTRRSQVLLAARLARRRRLRFAGISTLVLVLGNYPIA